MLVLTRKVGQKLIIDEKIKIQVLEVKGRQVRLGIDAPRESRIHREEVFVAISEENEKAAQSRPEDAQKLKKFLKP